jgi:hypothetical protein
MFFVLSSYFLTCIFNNYINENIFYLRFRIFPNCSGLVETPISNSQALVRNPIVVVIHLRRLHHSFSLPNPSSSSTNRDSYPLSSIYRFTVSPRSSVLRKQIRWSIYSACNGSNTIVWILCVLAKSYSPTASPFIILPSTIQNRHS